jgi:hypothetical protein
MSKASPTFELRVRKIEVGPHTGHFVVEEWIDNEMVNSFGPIPGKAVEFFVRLRREKVARTMSTHGYSRILLPKPILIS